MVIVTRTISFPTSYKIRKTIRNTICKTQTPYVSIKCSSILCLWGSWNKPLWGSSWAAEYKLWKYWHAHFILCFPCPSLFQFFDPYLVAATNLVKLLLHQRVRKLFPLRPNVLTVLTLISINNWTVSPVCCVFQAPFSQDFCMLRQLFILPISSKS